MAKTAKVSTRLEAETLAVLQKTAESDRRPIGALLRNIVEDWASLREPEVLRQRREDAQRRDVAEREDDFA